MRERKQKKHFLKALYHTDCDGIIHCRFINATIDKLKDITTQYKNRFNTDIADTFNAHLSMLDERRKKCSCMRLTSVK